MRTLAKLFGYSGGIVVVIVAGQYAYMTSDTPVFGAIWAFLYGFIAVGGLFGPALAARVWRYNMAAGTFIWAVALASLVIAISNEVGAMAGRGSEQTAQRSRVADTVSDTRASLDIAIAERKGLRFTPPMTLQLGLRGRRLMPRLRQRMPNAHSAGQSAGTRKRLRARRLPILRP